MPGIKITVPGAGVVKPIKPMALSRPRAVQNFGSYSSGAPDVSGTLRRAHQVLAGMPTGVRTKMTKPPKEAGMRIAAPKV